MRIIDCEQRSPEWYAARRGIPTASEFGCIITPAKLGYAAAADGYINDLVDEVVRPDAAQSFTGNRHTERGCMFEDEALEAYAFERDVIIRRVGFVLNDEGTLGCSPDALVAAEIDQRRIDMAEHGMSGVDWSLTDADRYAGGVECKCPDGHVFLKWYRAGGIPPEHKAQVHGSLIVTGAPWWDFVAYCPPYPLMIVRAVPDGFTDALRGHLKTFLGEYHKTRAEILEKIG